MSDQSAQIESNEDFKDSPTGVFDRWDTELQASFDATKKWHKQGNKTVKRFLDNRGAGEDDWFRLNLFHSNITTMRSMLFGKLPEIDVARTDEDFNDDQARVAAIMLKRILQNDIGTPNDQYSDTLRMCLDDRLIPGLGVARVRYEMDSEVRQVAAQMTIEGQVLASGYEEEILKDERAPIDYVHWRDFAWSPCRTWAEVRWVAFKTYMTREQLIERFGDKLGKQIPLTQTQSTKNNEEWKEKDDPQKDAWSRAEIWEIWNKEDKKLYWWCKEMPTILDTKPDPLGLTGFFPIPKPMVSNITTTAYMPIPDFVMAQDLYNEIDKLETRIALVTEAVKVVGVYDKSADGVKRMMTEGVENDLIPVDNWAMFAEKGGLRGMIDWMPYETIAGVIRQLTDRRNDAKALLFEITGMSDVMRGSQAAGGAVTATERALEARFASVRIQALQDEFANYATDLIRLRAEVISKHFDPQTIIEQSNIEKTPDAALAMAGVELIKNTPRLVWRIQVKPESVAMVDYASLKQDRTEFINGLAVFLQSAAPLVEQDPSATPFLLEMLKWTLAGFKGSENIEGVLDQAIQQMQQNAGQQQGEQGPSPEELKAQMEQQKSQSQQQLEQLKFNNEMQLTQAKMNADMQELQNEMKLRAQELQMETQQDVIKERAQMDANMNEERNVTAEFEKREIIKADQAIRVQQAKTRNEPGAE